MTTSDFLVFYGCVLAIILVCRCVPLFALKGRRLSARAGDALGLIPPAAFAALVANDLFDPAVGVMPAAALSTVLVAVVAVRSGSLIWSALVGMGSYALLSLAL